MREERGEQDRPTAIAVEISAEKWAEIIRQLGETRLSYQTHIEPQASHDDRTRYANQAVGMERVLDLLHLEWREAVRVYCKEQIDAGRCSRAG